jgi:hypothetical protein
MEYYSSPDMLGLIAELNGRRIPMVLGKRVQRQGGVMGLTPNQEKKLVAVREIHNRFMQGKYRHTEREEGIVKWCCDFLVEQHATNNNQPSNAGKFSWDAQKLRQTDLLTPDRTKTDPYQAALYGVQQW